MSVCVCCCCYLQRNVHFTECRLYFSYVDYKQKKKKNKRDGFCCHLPFFVISGKTIILTAWHTPDLNSAPQNH